MHREWRNLPPERGVGPVRTHVHFVEIDLSGVSIQIELIPAGGQQPIQMGGGMALLVGPTAYDPCIFVLGTVLLDG